jgi:hypothetical protein
MKFYSYGNEVMKSPWEPPRTLKETMMEAEFNHLNHATWECKYPVVFTPKYRKKLLFGKIKRHLGQVFHDLARRNGRSAGSRKDI